MRLRILNNTNALISFSTALSSSQVL